MTAKVTVGSRFGASLVVVAVGLGACGGETGEQVQRDIEEKIRTEVREAREAATERRGVGPRRRSSASSGARSAS